MHIPMLAWHVHLHIGGWAGKHMLIDKQGCHIFVKMSNQVLLPLDMFSKKDSTNALASSQFSDSSKEEDRSQCLSISNEVPYHNPRSNSSSSGVGSGSESGASINGESETSDYQRSTPSPRDDPFQENSIDSSSNKSKVGLTSKYKWHYPKRCSLNN